MNEKRTRIVITEDEDDPMSFMSEGQWNDVQLVLYEITEWTLNRYNAIVKQILLAKRPNGTKPNVNGITIVKGRTRIDLFVYYLSNVNDVDFFAEASAYDVDGSCTHSVKFFTWNKLKRYIGLKFKGG